MCIHARVTCFGIVVREECDDEFEMNFMEIDRRWNVDFLAAHRYDSYIYRPGRSWIFIANTVCWPLMLHARAVMKY